jgi:shikimate kinase
LSQATAFQAACNELNLITAPAAKGLYRANVRIPSQSSPRQANARCLLISARLTIHNMRVPSKSGKPRPPIVALTGFMAAGKSTVGRALGNLLQWNFFDLDYEIECREKLHVREIFRRHGEPHFRRLETGALRAVLKNASAPTVIALGGGTFVEQQNAALLQSYRAHVVFLEVAVELLLERCRAAGARCPENPRPLAEDADAFYELHAQRLPSYRRAKLIVNTQSKNAEQVAREIAAALKLTRPKR